MPVATTKELTELAANALRRAGANETAARLTAEHLVRADAQGLPTHGVSRVPFYCAHLRNGRIRGDAVPRVLRRQGACVLIDAADGLAYPASALAVEEGVDLARSNGIAMAGVTDSHHNGALGLHLETVARNGMIGLMFTNTPAAIPAAGGRQPLFGTNPIAAVFPRKDGAPPLVIDMAVSQSSRGALMLAAREKRPIPPGWAYGPDGQPTTDPALGMAGSMAAIGGDKGALLAMVVELLCVALTGAQFGFEAESFFNATGQPLRLGHALLVINPGAMGGQDLYLERVETLIETMLRDPDVRLPGGRRQEQAQRAGAQGIALSDALFAELKTLADR